MDRDNELANKIARGVSVFLGVALVAIFYLALR